MRNETMHFSLKTKVAFLITAIILSVSLFSTYLFISVHSRSKERGLIERGKALSYALSKAAQEGLINEDLDVIKKAANVVRASDVTLAEVYSDIWEAIDAYPIGRLKDAPEEEAVSHFRLTDEPFYLKTPNGWDFYRPISFQPSEESAPITIGFVRIMLSDVAIQKDLRNVIFINIAVSAVITLIAIVSLNLLIGRLVIRPVMHLHKRVARFRDGELPEQESFPEKAAAEIGELSAEFDRLCVSIREKEEKVVESGKRIASLFERVDHGIFRLDGNGAVVETNNRFKASFGEVKDLCDILIGDMSAPDCLKTAVAERGLHIEDRAIGKGGAELTISLTLYPENDAEGTVTGFDGYIIDITEKKRIEERLFRAQKMEAVGTLAGGMAHDFNNLLTAILGYAEIILSMTKEGDQFNKPATIIYDAAKRGADFGRKILAITRKEKIQTKAVNINEIIGNSLDLLRRSIPKNIECATNLCGDMEPTRADGSQIQQVIINLAINAVDAMPEGGRLTIETAVVGAENGAANNSYSKKNGYVRISVSDTGTGIDSTTQSKIFDPFFTTKEMGKGTGLGLYIVHSIVNNHGGYINLYSEPSKGTRFNIYLPIIPDSFAEHSPDDPEIGGTESVLIIDDEADVRELCVDMLEPLGYTVLRAANGSSGIGVFREMKDRIGVVILDMIMPKMGGSEVFQALKTIRNDVRILLCSGYSRNGFAGIDELLMSGAAGFVQKPFSRRTLALAIRKALENIKE